MDKVTYKVVGREDEGVRFRKAGFVTVAEAQRFAQSKVNAVIHWDPPNWWRDVIDGDAGPIQIQILKVKP